MSNRDCLAEVLFECIRLTVHVGTRLLDMPGLLACVHTLRKDLHAPAFHALLDKDEG